MTTKNKKRPKHKVAKPKAAPKFKRPREAALSGALPVMTKEDEAEFRELFGLAFRGEAPPLHETLLLAGYHHRSTKNIVVVADRLGMRVDAMREAVHKDPSAPMSAYQMHETDAAMAEIEIDPGWLRVFTDAHNGFWPELHGLILAAGYGEDDTVGTQRELAEWCGVDERTVRRWVADGSPVKRIGDRVRYPVWATLAWKRGIEAKEFAPPGSQIEGMAADIFARGGR